MGARWPRRWRKTYFAITGRDNGPHAVFIVAAATIVIVSHKDNIERLRDGVERRLQGEKATPITQTK